MEREQDRIQKDGERKCDMDGAQREFFVGEGEKEGKRERKWERERERERKWERKRERKRERERERDKSKRLKP